jgi:hypothetical protein
MTSSLQLRRKTKASRLSCQRPARLSWCSSHNMCNCSNSICFVLYCVLFACVLGRGKQPFFSLAQEFKAANKVPAAAPHATLHRLAAVSPILPPDQSSVSIDTATVKAASEILEEWSTNKEDKSFAEQYVEDLERWEELQTRPTDSLEEAEKTFGSNMDALNKCVCVLSDPAHANKDQIALLAMVLGKQKDAVMACLRKFYGLRAEVESSSSPALILETSSYLLSGESWLEAQALDERGSVRKPATIYKILHKLFTDATEVQGASKGRAMKALK